MTGEFEKNRTDDVSALAGSQLRELKKWVNETYHFKYVYLGLLEGHFYDRNGAPTAAFRDVASSRRFWSSDDSENKSWNASVA